MTKQRSSCLMGLLLGTFLLGLTATTSAQQNPDPAPTDSNPPAKTVPTALDDLSLKQGQVADKYRRLEEPIFTPASKADDGHDENISFDTMVGMVGADTAERLRELSLQIYVEARAFAEERNIIIADTKFEFGFIDGELSLIDEILTPDSSRFWPADQYESGVSPPSYDKQFVRDWLSDLGWDKNPPGPELPEAVVEATAGKYLEAYEQLTGIPLLGTHASEE